MSKRKELICADICISIWKYFRGRPHILEMRQSIKKRSQLNAPFFSTATEPHLDDTKNRQKEVIFIRPRSLEPFCDASLDSIGPYNILDPLPECALIPWIVHLTLTRQTFLQFNQNNSLSEKQKQKNKQTKNLLVLKIECLPGHSFH